MERQLKLIDDINTKKGLCDVIKCLYENKGLVIKKGLLCYKKSIAFSYGKDFVECFNRNYDVVYKMIKEKSGVDLGKDGNDKAIQRFFEMCVERKVMLKVRKKEGDVKMYPYVLFPPLRCNDDDVYKFEDKEYYWLNMFEEERLFKRIWLLVLLIVIIGSVVVLVGCLFHMWSIKVKIVVIWALIGFVFGLFVITFCSLFVTFIGFVCGYDVMLLPNIMEMNMSVKERVCNPFIACFPREDSFRMVVIRVSVVIGIAIMCSMVYAYPEVFNKVGSVVVERGMKVFQNVNNKLLVLFGNTNRNVYRNRKDDGL